MRILRKRGFTLIELLIVISIIGILAVALLPNIISAPATARDAGNKSAVNSMLAALEQVKANAGAYPANPTTGGTSEIMDDANADVASVKAMVKGNTFPKSKAAVAAAETVMGASITTAMSGAVPMVYCPLSTNDKGYSYVIAMKMEQDVSGANALDIADACSAIATGGTYTSPVASGTSKWYFMVQ